MIEMIPKINPGVFFPHPIILRIYSRSLFYLIATSSLGLLWIASAWQCHQELKPNSPWLGHTHSSFKNSLILEDSLKKLAPPLSTTYNRTHLLDSILLGRLSTQGPTMSPIFNRHLRTLWLVSLHPDSSAGNYLDLCSCYYPSSLLHDSSIFKFKNHNWIKRNGPHRCVRNGRKCWIWLSLVKNKLRGNFVILKN